MAVLFVIGVGLRRAGLAGDHDGQFLLRLLFFVALPCLILLNLASAEIPRDRALLPLIGLVICLGGLVLASVYGRLRGLDPFRLGPMVLGAMILNDAFLVPFVERGYGSDGLTDLLLVDIGNSLVVTLIAFPLAYRFGGHDADLGAALRRAATSPLTWALVAALVFNLTNTPLPRAVTLVASPLAALVGPLVLIALGILFRPSLRDLDHLAGSVALRMVGGLIIGLAAIAGLGLTGTTADVVLLAAASPTGFTALTFSSLAGLDVDAAARAVSASLAIGLVAVPLFITLTS